MRESRIVFHGNPWPEGHRIKNFKWTAEIIDGFVWFYFHLETEDYHKDGPGAECDEAGRDADWKSPITWKNFHKCTISATYWNDESGFSAGSWRKFSLDKLDGKEFAIDPLPVKDPEEEQRAFHIYLLGHDEVADHRIRFSRDNRTGLFNIHWKGKIALAYIGDYEFRHSFEASIYGVEAPDFPNKRPFRLMSLFTPGRN